jgi:predicted RNase H-like HicB family nuclease
MIESGGRLTRSGWRRRLAVIAQLTLEYWPDGDWLVGRLREVPGVFSQGRNLEELQANVRDAYALMREAVIVPAPNKAQTVPIGVEV